MSVTRQTVLEDLSLHDMLRIMDVARILRQEQEMVERELDRDETVALLRERLMASVEITGHAVTPEEVDAAIKLYFDNLHTFQDPPLGPQKVLAQLYIRRQPIVSVVSLVLAVSLIGWWLFVSASGPFSQAGRINRAIVDHMISVKRTATSVRSLSEAPETLQQLRQFEFEASAADKAKDVSRLEGVRHRLTRFEERLQEEYEVHIVSDHGQKSGLVRNSEDEDDTRSSAYYLIVRARTSFGRVISRTIPNVEVGYAEQVDIWAERVPQAVYERIQADREEDAVLSETLFAVKKRGETGVRVVLKGEDGEPLERDSQITRW